MNSAEFKTVRQCLGISAIEFASFLQIDYRAVQRMENAKTNPKTFAVEQLLILYKFFRATFYKHCSQIDTLISADVKNIVLIRYRKENFKLFNSDWPNIPEQIHSTILGRLKEHYEAKNIEIRIVYFDPINYSEWLGDRKDSKENRSAWATGIAHLN